MGANDAEAPRRSDEEIIGETEELFGDNWCVCADATLGGDLLSLAKRAKAEVARLEAENAELLAKYDEDTDVLVRTRVARSKYNRLSAERDALAAMTQEVINVLSDNANYGDGGLENRAVDAVLKVLESADPSEVLRSLKAKVWEDAVDRLESVYGLAMTVEYAYALSPYRVEEGESVLTPDEQARLDAARDRSEKINKRERDANLRGLAASMEAGARRVQEGDQR